MTTRTTLTALTLTAALVFATNARDAQAAHNHHLVIKPAPSCNHGLPKFGFSSQTIYGVGEHVTYVRPYGLAAEMGLEIGDIILELNHMSLTFHGAWNHALRDAMRHGGHVELTIRDVRTGNVVYRHVDLGSGIGPITPKSAPVAYSTKALPPNTGTYYYNSPSTGNSTAGPITQKSIAPGPQKLLNHGLKGLANLLKEAE